jgi:hypothetical protein
MAELVVAFCELCVWDPNRETLILVLHAEIDLLASSVRKAICDRAEGADQQLLLDPVTNGVHGVVQTTVCVRVWLDVPGLGAGSSLRCGPGQVRLALHTRGSVVWDRTSAFQPVEQRIRDFGARGSLWAHLAGLSGQVNNPT